MKYTDEQLNDAVKNEIFTNEQIDQFKEFVNKNNSGQITKFQKLLYYGGGLLIISAMTWLMTTNWKNFGAVGVTIISAVYFIIFFFAGEFLFFKKNLEVAGGILYSVSIAIIPLFVFSLLKAFDFWPENWEYNDYYFWIKGKWLILELSLIAVALPILLRTKFSFIVFLIAGSLWFLSMDIIPIIEKTTKITWTERANISIIFGTIMILIGYFADIKFKKDYAFWMYLFGLIILSSGLSVFYNVNLFKFIVLGIANLILIFVSLFLNRNAFLVFGTIGLIQFLSRLSWKYFEDSVIFPFALTIIGVLLIVLGIYFQKNRKNIEEKLIKKLPSYILKLRPKRNLEDE
ncbi:MAG: hypothetical protein FWB86_00750 [Treponema sp.]|nr:hypothetical protein [Treponema sp.]MCL2250624.1 hypothetical protein [Treponema sp.]